KEKRMRLKHINANPTSGKIEIEIGNDDMPFVVMVSDGRVKTTELPAFGVTSIVTHQNKVKRVKFDEGEDF
ncbi:XtrA/YqaO family protein, partial [Halalkalibacter sp. AB-rgal2]|uniref:XtrA/YqaO family protein n=1 Tax=Halalkalibacter sp. AB-rgal2 TaxID=3242695 RepID=UPI00359E3F51